MTRRAQAEATLNRFGQTVTVGDAQVKAIIQPLQFRSTNNYEDCTHFLYTGPAANKPIPGGTVTAGNRNFSVIRCDTVILAGEELYVRAVLLLAESGVIRLENGGTVVARAANCTVKALCDADAVIPWGENEADSIAGGAVRWELALTGVKPENGVNLFSGDSFHVVMVRNGETVTYTGCRWKSIQNDGGQTPYRLEILAANRTVQNTTA